MLSDRKGVSEAAQYDHGRGRRGRRPSPPPPHRFGTIGSKFYDERVECAPPCLL